MPCFVNGLKTKVVHFVYKIEREAKTGRQKETLSTQSDYLISQLSFCGILSFAAAATTATAATHVVLVMAAVQFPFGLL